MKLIKRITEDGSYREAIIGWKYLSIIDNRTSDICLDLNGQEFNKGDDAN